MTVEKLKPVGKDDKATVNVRRRQERPEAALIVRRGTALSAEKSAKTIAASSTVISTQVPVDAILKSATGTIIDHASLLFDPVWYSATYPDVVAAGLDPVRHFFDNGAREGRDPNQHFETKWYLSTNADVVASKMNPFLHYLFYGAWEGRKPRP